MLNPSASPALKPESEIRKMKCKDKWPDILQFDRPSVRIEWPCVCSCLGNFHCNNNITKSMTYSNALYKRI